MRYLLRIFIVFICAGMQFHAWGGGIQRIVSLAPSLTMNLYYLEAQSQLVGCTSYCEIAKNDHKQIVANAVKVNLEKVVSLKPDLVVTTSLTDPETIQSLRKFGLRVEVFPGVKSFDDICAQFLRLGKLVGKEQKAISLINTSKAQVESLKKKVHAKGSRVFFQIGSDPLFTVLTNTFMNDFILFAGATNIFAELSKGTITREAVLARDPDIIIVVSMGLAGEEEKKTWESYKQLKAVKKKQVFVIDSDLACTPTPVSFVKTFETIVKLIGSK
jgi:iron complex transport system substrate-binding protein